MNGTKTYYIQPLKDSGIPIKSNASLPTTQEHDYVSAVFVRLLQPIADLCDQMLRLSSGEPNEVQTSPRENGYAISIIALAAFLLEGACGRVRYVSGWNQKQCSPAATLRHFGANDLADRVEEIFVVRDAIAHAHLWTAKISWTENNLRFAQQPVQLPGYGNKKFRRIVDPAPPLWYSKSVRRRSNSLSRRTGALCISRPTTSASEASSYPSTIGCGDSLLSGDGWRIHPPGALTWSGCIFII